MATTLMIRRVAATVFIAAASFNLSHALANSAVNRSQDQSQPKAQPTQKADPKPEAASLTGCVDEQAGKWVLVNDHTMAVIANLAADGFPTEAFAKYMGHKVTVRGTVNSNGSSSTFKVREIQTLSETCAAQ